MGMLLKRDFVTHDALYVALRRALCRPAGMRLAGCEDCGRSNQPTTPGSATPRNHDQDAVGEGWLMSAADKARVRAVMDSGDAYVAAGATGTIASMRF